jgi:hypothetical protein
MNTTFGTLDYNLHTMETILKTVPPVLICVSGPSIVTIYENAKRSTPKQLTLLQA